MIRIDIIKLAQAVCGEFVTGYDGSAKVSGVCIDSRNVNKGNVFFAVCGDNFDGHDYVKKAFENGAVCAVCSRKVEGVENIIRVDDTVKALGRLANFYRNRAKFKVVAITGSAGKTTTRQIAHHVLSKFYKCHQAKKSYNNNIGLPLTLLGANDDCQLVIAEIGTNNPGEISELTKIAEPDVALVNNIFPAHLEGLGSIKGIIAEKASIIEGLKPNGKFLINGDFPDLVDYCRKEKFEFERFGTGKDCQIRGEDLILDGFSGSITFEGVKAVVPLGGMGNLHNTIAAWAVCKEFGITAGQFADSVKTLPAISMRMDVKNYGTVTVIDDCYNANPASMQNAVEFLADLTRKQNRRSTFVCGEMAELGEESERLHEELAETIAKSGIETVLVTGPRGKIVADTLRRLQGCADVFAFKDTAQLCENIINYVRSDDIILIKGSRSGRLEAVLERISEYFGK